MPIRPPTALLLLTFTACTARPETDSEELRLTPLSPYHVETVTPKGLVRSDYFFVPAGHRDSPGLHLRLRRLLDLARSPELNRYALYSIYLYERTPQLHDGYRGAASDLRGVFDEALLAYARWNQAEFDLFYIIDGGRVVFDGLAERQVSPAWEFD